LTLRRFGCLPFRFRRRFLLGFFRFALGLFGSLAFCFRRRLPLRFRCRFLLGFFRFLLGFFRCLPLGLFRRLPFRLFRRFALGLFHRFTLRFLSCSFALSLRQPGLPLGLDLLSAAFLFSQSLRFQSDGFFVDDLGLNGFDLGCLSVQRTRYIQVQQ